MIMRPANPLVIVACFILGGVSIAHGAPPPTPLKVTLSLASPCGTPVYQSIGLKAQITGGYQAPGPGYANLVVTKYTFFGPDGVIKQDTSDTTAWWLPTLPGFYYFNVGVKQTYPGGGITQASAETSVGCPITKATNQVTLTVKPSSGAAVAPPQKLADIMSLTATIWPPYPNAKYRFSFGLRNVNTNNEEVKVVTNADPSATWTPFTPQQPADPGTYMIYVWGETVRTLPQGDVVFADGKKTIENYRAHSPMALGNVGVQVGEMQKLKPPTRPMYLDVDPPSPAPSTSSITMNARFAVNLGGVTNKFTFSYIPSVGGQAIGQVISTSDGIQTWTLTPQPPPGTYTLTASIEMRRNTDNAILGVGSAQIANFVVAGAIH